MHYLGHVIRDGQAQPDPEKIETIQAIERPHTKTEVRSFLDLVNFYRNFIENFVELAAPLTDLPHKAEPKQVVWTLSCESAFSALKERICSSPVLRSPDPSRPYILQVDASNRVIGAILAQTSEGVKHPVAYASRKLLLREKKYATIEKCLAIVWAMKHFHVYVDGQNVTVQSDHNALRWLNNSRQNNDRLQSWSLLLQAYQIKIDYKQGCLHSNADALSRIYGHYDQNVVPCQGLRSASPLNM